MLLERYCSTRDGKRGHVSLLPAWQLGIQIRGSIPSRRSGREKARDASGLGDTWMKHMP